VIFLPLVYIRGVRLLRNGAKRVYYGGKCMIGKVHIS